jgi:hypothetical protein
MQYIVPSLTVLAWLFAGPRGLLRFAHVLPMLIIPLLWLTCTLLLGQLIDAYPYDFLDVATYGLGPVLVTSAAIVVVATILGFILVGIDRLISSKGRPSLTGVGSGLCRDARSPRAPHSTDVAHPWRRQRPELGGGGLLRRPGVATIPSGERPRAFLPCRARPRLAAEPGTG